MGGWICLSCLGGFVSEQVGVHMGGWLVEFLFGWVDE